MEGFCCLKLIGRLSEMTLVVFMKLVKVIINESEIGFMTKHIFDSLLKNSNSNSNMTFIFIPRVMAKDRYEIHATGKPYEHQDYHSSVRPHHLSQ